MPMAPSSESPGTEELITEGLRSLSPLDRSVWATYVERRLRNPKSTIWLHVPKDGVTASTLDLVARLWMLFIWAAMIGLVLLDLGTGLLVVSLLGWLLIAAGLATFLIACSRVVKASQARRAWRKAARSTQ
jgi:hypothetical protein